MDDDMSHRQTVALLSWTSRMRPHATKTADSQSKVAESTFTYRFAKKNGRSSSIIGSDGEFQALFLGSDSPFCVEKIKLEGGPFKGRTAFVFDPLPPPQNIFPILQLPPEIRTMIWEYVITYKGTIDINKLRWQGAGFFSNGATNIDKAIMYVNKQISSEILPLLYSRNEFCFDSTRVAVQFFDCIGSNVVHLQRVGISFHWYKSHGITMVKQLLKAHHLRYIAILRPYGQDIEKVAPSFTPWIKRHGKTEETLRDLESMIRFVSCVKCKPKSHEEGSMEVSRHCMGLGGGNILSRYKMSSHLRELCGLKEDVYEFTDDEFDRD